MNIRSAGGSPGRNRPARRRSPVTTYYRSETPADAPSPFVRKPARRNHRRYLLGILDVIVILIVLTGVGYTLSLKSQPKIIASNFIFHSRQAYQTAAASQLRQLKNRNKITFDEQSLTSAMEKEFPEIGGVQVELPFFSEQPTIRLSIAQPSFVLRSRGNEYVVDSEGVAVPAANLINSVRNRVIVDDQSGFDVKAGNRVLSSQSVGFINTLIAQCQRAKVPVSSLSLPAAAQELYLHTSDQPYFVKFYLGGDVLDETGQFLAARHHFAQTKQLPSQYLDVRVAGKIFYK